MLIAVITLLIIKPVKQTSDSVTDTSRVLKSPFVTIKNFANRLSPSARLFITIILGLCTGYGWRIGSFYAVVLGVLLMVSAVGLTVKLSNNFIKVVAFLCFALSSLLLLSFDSSMIAADIYSYIIIFAVVWIILYGFASYALNSKPDNFQYASYICSWLILFSLSFASKYLIIAGMIPLMIIKIYQLLLIDGWTLKRAKAYVFSVVYPMALFTGLLIYAHYETQAAETLANEVAQKVVDYHDKTGNYPAENIIMRENMEYNVNYALSTGGEPYLRYKKPMIATCSYTYLFDIDGWEERCLD